MLLPGAVAPEEERDGLQVDPDRPADSIEVLNLDGGDQRRFRLRCRTALQGAQPGSDGRLGGERRRSGFGGVVVFVGHWLHHKQAARHWRRSATIGAGGTHAGRPEARASVLRNPRRRGCTRPVVVVGYSALGFPGRCTRHPAKDGPVTHHEFGRPAEPLRRWPACAIRCVGHHSRELPCRD